MLKLVGANGVVRRSTSHHRNGVTMRIDRNERIAGLPALEVRRHMREIGENHIDVETTARVLGKSKSKASKALAGLLGSGLLIEDNGRFTRTVTGRALAAATAAKPLLTKTAERLVADIVGRARLANEADVFA